MTTLTDFYLKTGGDPRALPDYAALRDELSKLSHPARPDVNWHAVETLCLRLFEQHGVELQTTAWYTLARTQLTGLPGLNEGLAILEALLTHQWGALWPQPVHARMEILTGLSQRLQQVMRTLTFTYPDLSALYQAEQHLTRSGDVLQRLELRHLSQLDSLRTQLHNAAVRLENSGNTGPDGIPAGIALPPVAVGKKPTVARQWVFVAQPETEITVVVPGPRRSFLRPFLAGMVVMLVAGSTAVWGWQTLHRPDPLLVQLNASLAPLPEVLTEPQLAMLTQRGELPEDLVARTQQQLTWLNRLPPDYAFRQGQQLVRQIQMLWPDQFDVVALVRQWQQQRDATALPAESLNGWHQGMEQLQRLADRLNGLDEQHGKYLTVSELKSQVFTIMQSFNRSVPAEEQLRQMAAQASDAQVSPALTAATDNHLRQLLARYSMTGSRHEAADTVP
ncbi:MAG: type VI secretion system ImpA family N-terminal domain-containing protein [Yokenella regensburgei]|jgi:type VI secretion system protein VasL|nr:type VI secretion system ImpA family N-terminal domain-containing protein [Yokenella regensburgei]